MPTLSQGWIAASVVTIALQIVMPLAIAVVVQRRLGVSWRYFAYGMLIFFLFQIATRVPVIQLVQGAIAVSLTESRPLLWVWIFVASLTAGLFEEVGRWVGYRFLMGGEKKTWAKGVMYGLGHAGLESMLLVAGLSVVSLAGLLALSPTALQALPPGRREQVLQQLAQVAAQPEWYPLFGAWERLCTIAVHVALSVVVLQVFRRGSLVWLWLAIAAHTAVNLVAAGMVQVLGPGTVTATMSTEAALTVIASIAFWTILTLRDRSPEPLVAEAGPR
ncbi:MAG: YhfC family intramembrane metalloprotease [Chloroflexi bacterium]|nr:YhfC family intramembrane metalloprotease [Chloroflexota bacterium]